MTDLFNDGQRDLQDKFDTRRLADRVGERIIHQTFSDTEREFIEAQPMFFLATTDAEGHVSCSYKGGTPGFVRIVEEDTVAFPSYDGNGMFMSMGNVAENGEVGMLFVDFASQSRTRVNGVASIDFDDPLIGSFPDAQLVVRVKAREIFFNCPRYIHRMEMVEPSVYAPTGEEPTPVPPWKRTEGIKEALAADDASHDSNRPTGP
jgi:predicted pyridoxine 5'-phosphate oxidase superfamily flavin-nucleotide-binding protein